MPSGELGRKLSAEDSMARQLNTGDRSLGDRAGREHWPHRPRAQIASKIEGHEVAASEDNPEYPRAAGGRSRREERPRAAREIPRRWNLGWRSSGEATNGETRPTPGGLHRLAALGRRTGPPLGGRSEVAPWQDSGGIARGCQGRPRSWGQADITENQANSQ
jgi:hypothetical protein